MPLAAFPKCFIDSICVEKSMTVYDWIEATATMDIDGLEFYWPMTPSNDPRYTVLTPNLMQGA